MKPTPARLRSLRRLGVRYVKVEPSPPSDPGRTDLAAPSGEKPVCSPSPSAEMDGPLESFRRTICGCQKCPLGKARKQFVFGSGNPHAEVMFVGEAPGADEDEQGLPFVGRAGQLLTKIIESTQTWKREDVYICNVLKCRPPGNRTPLPEEVEQCRSYLEEQIRLVKPRLIMALGASAAQALLQTKEPVGKLRNRWLEVFGVPVRVTFHPAYLLRDPGRKRDVWEDMKVLTARYLEVKTSR